jgi:hypothetical protein
MPNYQNGKIYTIRSHLTDEIYIGSTANSLSKRLNDHKSNFKYWKTGKRDYITSFKIIEFGDAYIELLENYACADKNELNRREGELIRSTDCVNKFIAGRTQKEYYVDNKETILAQKKQYHQDNRDTILAQKKQYQQDNKEKYLAYQKQHYEKNKEIRTCVCGSNYNYGHTTDRYRHYRSNKHTEFVENFYNNLQNLNVI